MECNKEEAIRAKSIAECRMQNKDFEGARKIALKAQNLFPDLDGISQILAVCEVHCAAANNMVGATDWYGILQVETTADESTIKKQYRKLALLLHPDKNKLAGAEGAFQQVGHAYKLLSDPAKRSRHDMILRANFSGLSLNQPARQSYRTSVKKQPGPGVSNTAAKSTFPRFNASTVEFRRAKPGDSAVNQGSKLEHSPNFVDKPNDDLIRSNAMKFRRVQLQPVHGEEKVEKPRASHRNTRNEVKLAVETGADRTNILRRSKRRKQKDTCEVQDDCMNSQPPASKRSRQGSKQVDTVQNNNAFPGVIAKGREENGNSHGEITGFSNFEENSSYPAPEFSNFEDEKSKSKFVVDQIWALYENIDGMPRLYARVKKVYNRGFRLEMNWLENDPRSIDEMKWSEKGLPISCGSFKLGESFNTQDRHIFSHLVQWRRGMRRNSYMIYPKKGEIWALFSNWDVRWISEPDDKRVFKYEVVEVVSDFGVSGITVHRLAKIKEFMALFVRADDTEETLFEIPAKDVLKFSHRVPACQMTGKEEDGVPEGAFELDCASLPSNFEVIFDSISIEVIRKKISQPKMENGFEPTAKLKAGTRSPPSKKTNILSGNEIGTKAENTSSQSPNTEHRTGATRLISFEYPESEFHDFESDRQMEKFDCGQIWAFYCDIDSFPKFYGRISDVDREDNKVIVRWLDVYPPSHDNDDPGAEDKPPPACGVFRYAKDTCTMDSGETFSHLAKAKPMATKDHYYIFPDAGDVWAVFKNWSGGGRSAYDPRHCEFDIVEISACDASGYTTSLLTKVDGYVSVFKRASEAHGKLIPSYEFSRFSHRIPSYRLTKEMGSSSYWELDPAAVPTAFLTSKS